MGATGSGPQAEQALVRDILATARTVAVVGLSPRPDRPSHEVARYLQEHGYHIVPVRPAVDSVLGEPAYPSLEAIPFPVDAVCVFRRPEEAPAVIAAAARCGARAVWLQEGVGSPAAEAAARRAGLPLVMDRCMMKEHRRLREG